jgi:hypothetical protein
MKQRATIETGTVGDDVWVGVPPQRYDEVRRSLSGKTLHVFRFTVDEAEAVIQMLQTEVARQKKTRVGG